MSTKTKNKKSKQNFQFKGDLRPDKRELQAHIRKLSKLVPPSKEKPAYVQLEFSFDPPKIDWFNIFNEDDGWFTPVK